MSVFSDIVYQQFVNCDDVSRNPLLTPIGTYSSTSSKKKMTDKFPTSWFLVILIPFGLLIPHITDPCENESEDSDPPAQELTAEMLPRFINISMNPCSDFYEFTCGIWKSEHPIGPCKSAINQFHILGDKVAAKMRATFESPEVLQSKSACTAKAIYRKCMDREELNRIGAKNMIREIREYSVSWPMLDRDKWRHERFNLTTLLIDALRKRGVQAFIRTDIITDTKNATRAVIEFSQGFLRLGPHRDHYLDKEKYKEKIDAYQKVFVKLVKLIHEETNVSIDEKAIAYDVGKIFEFESKLAGITEAKEDLRNFTEMYNLRRLSDVGILMPLIDWNTYFHSVAPSSIHKYLAADPPVLLAQIDYMRRLTNLLNSTDSVTITNYVYTAYSLALIDELGERYEGVAREFKYLTFGRKSKTPVERLLG
ncbi:hypothetical protein KIN20_016738 [Parelaphostrongylus tenuis]|uniref:Peptidase M13 N-terminal domain-containing protein n=1 Tax=Parelaphostrongylus tenuis TaxID=148309 RepID=A0AAD5QQX4_PARTN|nr:hypothetical protein KIN20_016738 [Parelaphostrongylus tenuis]